MPVRQDKSEPTASSARNGGFLCLLFAVFLGAFAPVTHDWYGPLGMVIAGAGMYLVGSGRIYRPALTRTPDAITCRYNPWREGSLYVALIVLPGVGLAAILSDSAIVRLAGIAAFVMAPVRLFFYLWRGRHGLLRIGPAALTVPVPAQRYAVTEIPRESVLSISAGTGRRLGGDTGPVTQIAYLPPGPAPSAPGTVLIGPTNSKNTVWVTIEQADLVAALQTWHISDPRGPALLDRVEAALRGAGSPTTGRPDADGPASGSPRDQPPGLSAPHPRTPAAPYEVYDYPPEPGDGGIPSVATSPGYGADPYRTPAALPGYPSGQPGQASPAAGPLALPPGSPPPPAAEPSPWRWLKVAAVGVAALIAASATPMFGSAPRASDPTPGATSAPPPAGGRACPSSGVAVATLTKKSDAEPFIYLPLVPGWADLPDTATSDPTSSVRAYIANDSLREDGFTPFIQVDLTSTTSTQPGRAIADELYAKAGAMMTVSNRTVGSVCGSTVYRADISGYNPDGKGPQSGSSVFTVVEGSNGVRWVAIATIKTRNPDNPGYIAQRDALVDGFHARFP